jgi:hypothetical protein
MMRPSRSNALVAGAIALAGVAGATRFASAQVNCDTMVGPARSDCYIGTARINREKSAIAAGVARQRIDGANLYRVTRSRPKTISAPKRPATER